MQNKYWNLLLAITMLTISCSVKITESENNDVLDDFPNHVGTFWVYARTDSTNLNTVTIDTVTITIADSIDIIGAENANIWVTEYAGHIDTQYVSIKSDTVFFYKPNPRTVRDYYIFPLEVGNGWGVSSDTSYVFEQAPKITPAGEFDDSYLITRHSENLPVNSPCSLKNKLYLSPNLSRLIQNDRPCD